MKRIGRFASIFVTFLLITGIVFTSCSNDTQPPAPEPEFSVHAYEAVELSDVPAWGSEYESYSGSDWETDYPIERNLALFFQGVGRTFEALELLDEDSDSYDEDAVFNPRSIEAGMHLKVRDEGFSVDSDSEPIVDFLINYFDVLMEGDISSLTQFISFFSFENNPEELIELNGHVALSGKVTSIGDPAFYWVSPVPSNSLHYNYSLYADLDIGTDIDTDESSSGTISGELKYSGVMNIVIHTSDSISLFPQLFTIEVKPFADCSLVDIQDAMDEIDDMTDPTSADIFGALKPALWGTTSDWCIRITRTVADAAGAAIADRTKTWSDDAAIGVIADFVNFINSQAE